MPYGDGPFSAMTEKRFRELLMDHARASKSRSLSYHDVALQIGRLITTIAIFWWLLGFPGAAGVHAWWWREVVPHETLITVAIPVMVVIVLSLEAARWHWRCPDGLREVLGWPAKFVGSLFHSAQLLLGVAAVGIVAIVPGAYAVFLLGLNAP
jgi:hypothetical protein